ncbi:MAG: AAA family ATPase [Desulfovibrio sp.]|nr:AAA family ATPase [Desulfovibrio sp.]
MLKLAVYGKGGIGKSTMTSNLSAAFALLGKKVIQIGCDPKADSTMTLLSGTPVTSVMDYLRGHDALPEDLSIITKRGFGHVLCIETGGPTPGIGCAGRGIITTFQLLNDLSLFDEEKPDVVLYDVLGDVVCGGFAAPIREGYAEHILIVTSGEKMALYAARNIVSAVSQFEDRSYASIAGILFNARNVPNEREKIKAFSTETGLPVLAEIPRSDVINTCEDRGMTVLEGAPDSAVATLFTDLAARLLTLPPKERLRKGPAEHRFQEGFLQ